MQGERPVETCDGSPHGVGDVPLLWLEAVEAGLAGPQIGRIATEPQVHMVGDPQDDRDLDVVPQVVAMAIQRFDDIDALRFAWAALQPRDEDRGRRRIRGPFDRGDDVLAVERIDLDVHDAEAGQLLAHGAR